MSEDIHELRKRRKQYAREGNWEKALQIIDQMITIDPKPSALIKRGVISS